MADSELSHSQTLWNLERSFKAEKNWDHENKK